MSVDSTAQVVPTVSNTLFVLAFALGYCGTVKLYRKWFRESKEAHAAAGHPIASAGYNHLPEIRVAVRNFTAAPAKDITFDFLAPLGNPSGFVLSDLGHFEKGPLFLTPQEGINRYWNRLPTLSPMLKEKGLEEGNTPERRWRYHRLTKADDTVAVPSGHRPAT